MKRMLHEHNMSVRATLLHQHKRLISTLTRVETKNLHATIIIVANTPVMISAYMYTFT